MFGNVIWPVSQIIGCQVVAEPVIGWGQRYEKRMHICGLAGMHPNVCS